MPAPPRAPRGRGSPPGPQLPRTPSTSAGPPYPYPRALPGASSHRNLSQGPLASLASALKSLSLGCREVKGETGAAVPPGRGALYLEDEPVGAEAFILVHLVDHQEDDAGEEGQGDEDQHGDLRAEARRQGGRGPRARAGRRRRTHMRAHTQMHARAQSHGHTVTHTGGHAHTRAHQPAPRLWKETQKQGTREASGDEQPAESFPLDFSYHFHFHQIPTSLLFYKRAIFSLEAL